RQIEQVLVASSATEVRDDVPVGHLVRSEPAASGIRRIDCGAIEEMIGPGATGQGVTAIAAHEGVSASSADDGIGTVVAVEIVIPAAAGDGVLAVAADEDVIARSGGAQCVAGIVAKHNVIVAAAAAPRVLSVSKNDRSNKV